MDIQFYDAEIVPGAADRSGVLAYANGKLAAIVVQLSGPEHGTDRGSWFVEAGFGACRYAEDVFADLASVRTWIADKLSTH